MKPSLYSQIETHCFESQQSSQKMKFMPQLVPKSQINSSRWINFILLSCSLCIIYLFTSMFLIHNFKYLNRSSSESETTTTATSMEHFVFGIASSRKSWPERKDYAKLWWSPRQMRGCAFVEPPPPNTTDLDPDADPDLPPVCVSGETERFRYTYRGGLRSAIRVARVVSETVALNYSGVRWFVFGDDDTVFFPENLVKTMSKYDHELWHYVGTNSEIYVQNKFFSFEMAFGGGGFAISYPLAKVLAKVFDSCLERYPHLYGSDGRIHACVAELGIGLTREPGFHQMDVRGNIFGLLAAHPNTPLISLHHLDHTEPIFPNMTTTKALRHLLEASKIDPHRLLQQTVCYDRWFSWTISVSWGYAVRVFGNHVPLPEVLRVPKTFDPWRRGEVLSENFVFDTRADHPDPCRRPAVFFFEKANPGGGGGGGGIVSSYRRMVGDNCTSDEASPRKLEEIRVKSHKMELDAKQAPRRHCCDVSPSSARGVLEIDIRECGEEELIFMHP